MQEYTIRDLSQSQLLKTKENKMTFGDIIKTVQLEGETTICLDQIMPLQPLNDTYEAIYYIDDLEQGLFEGVYYANKVIVSSKSETEVQLILGHGYLSEKAESWSNRFITDDIWQGGDGIFSFNMTDGHDGFDQPKQSKTLFVFGDSFIGRFDHQSQKRLEPHLMPNNTFAYLDNGKLDFRINRGEMGDVTGFYELPKRYDYKGPIARNLVTYNPQKPVEGYISAYNPQENIELIFDLYTNRDVTQLHIYNYYSEELHELNKRGMKSIELYGSLDHESWHKVGSYTLLKANDINDYQTIDINQNYRYYKLTCEPIIGEGNYNDADYQEGLFALNKIKFFVKEQVLTDIEVTANSVMRRENEHGWLWLQDGVVIQDQLYFLPLMVGPDASQPEGLQFKVMGVNLFKTPIVHQEIKPSLSESKFAPVFAYDKDSSYFFGAGMMANTINAGAKNPDGYIYIYGYKTTLGLREMVVARVKEERFEFFDDWRYFNGEGYSASILDAKPLLSHISCEMSVSEILEGKNKGKYLAVFTYDVDSPYVAIAIGETPVGPFTNAQRVYHTPEQAIFKSTTYTYNAKAHPHLSQSQKVLVSYNTNTYNFDHNMSNRLIYKPRFIYLNEI